MATIQNFTIEQNATFKKRLIWKATTGKPVNLTGYTAKLQIRDTALSAAVLFELSTANGRISLTPVPGVIDLVITDEDTGAISFTSGVYDLNMFLPDGSVRRLIQGKITVSAGVTKP